jgi:hypothetical protein
MATYSRPDGVVVGTGQQIIDSTSAPFTPPSSGIWQTGTGMYLDSTVWTGSTSLASVPVSDTCTDWTSTMGSGGVGRSTFTAGGAFWSNGTSTCDILFSRLYCVEE